MIKGKTDYTMFYKILRAAAVRTDQIVGLSGICNIVTVYLETVIKLKLKNLLRLGIYSGSDAFH